MYLDMLKIIKLGRPQFLFGGFLLFTMGALLAVLFNAPFSSDKFIFGYFILALAHLALHYSNDYFDMNADQFIKPTPISGGSGILIENPNLRQFSKKFAITLIFLSITFAAIFTIIYSYTLWFLLYVILGNYLVWFYSAPPVALAYRGFGEISNGMNGILLSGMGYFTMMGSLDLALIIFAIPLTFLQFIFTIGVEIPDMEGDKLGGKITWIVSRGRSFGFKLIAILGALAVVSFFLLPFTNLFPSNINFRFFALISLIPLTLGIIGLFKKQLNRDSATKMAIMDVASVFVVAMLIDLCLVNTLFSEI
ncbi:MAG: prenyltransferase [Methanobacterium sp.]|jgi:1,4-dihydroxy-2-naphthoate octaprenyltransferase|nr:prenyltransferase [Methanobacterium sp.]